MIPEEPLTWMECVEFAFILITCLLWSICAGALLQDFMDKRGTKAIREAKEETREWERKYWKVCTLSGYNEHGKVSK